jgi:hypothetical protein
MLPENKVANIGDWEVELDVAPETDSFRGRLGRITIGPSEVRSLQISRSKGMKIHEVEQISSRRWQVTISGGK